MDILVNGILCHLDHAAAWAKFHAPKAIEKLQRNTADKAFDPPQTRKKVRNLVFKAATPTVYMSTSRIQERKNTKGESLDVLGLAFPDHEEIPAEGF